MYVEQEFATEEVSADSYYDHWMKHSVYKNCKAPKHRERLQTCIDLIPEDISYVFDVGCATGHCIEMMETFRENLIIVGIDFSQRMIDEAKKFFPKGLFLFFEDSISYAKHFTNHKPTLNTAIICSEVIEHIKDDKKFVKDIMTGCSLGIFTTPNAYVKDPGHLRLYTEESLRELFSDFANVSIISKNTFFYIKVSS